MLTYLTIALAKGNLLFRTDLPYPLRIGDTLQVNFTHTRTYKGRKGKIDLTGTVEVVQISYIHRHIPTQSVTVRYRPNCDPKWVNVKNDAPRPLAPTKSHTLLS